MYLYRAVDSEGNTIDFYLRESRDKQAAKRFFKKALSKNELVGSLTLICNLSIPFCMFTFIIFLYFPILNPNVKLMNLIYCKIFNNYNVYIFTKR